MALQTTEFVIVGSPMDPTFKGKPQEFYEHILERMKIVSPTGISTFITGNQQPTSDRGPWLKDGTQWWVWSDSEKSYVPLDISESEKIIYRFAQTEPTEDIDDVVFWFEQDTSGRVINLWVRSGTTFYPMTPTSGTTAERPSNPAEFQKYFDTTIEVEIYWRKSKWRTVEGVQGDVKFVTASTLERALQLNPGWIEVGDSSLGVGARGRAFIPAHADAGTSPAADFTPLTGITSRKVGDQFGEENHILSEGESGDHQHWFGFNYSGDDHVFTATNASGTVDPYGERPVSGEAGGGYQEIGRTSVNLKTLGAVDYVDPDAHENQAPRIAAWCLVKEDI